MKTKLLLCTLIAFIIFGCDQSGDSKKTENQTKDIIDKVIYPSDSGAVVLNLNDGHVKDRIYKKEGEHIYIEFNSGEYSRLYGLLSSEDSLANIRFAQIFMPDGTMDGPFGREIRYDLAKNKEYKISVTENMMAGDPWAGIFMVEIRLSN